MKPDCICIGFQKSGTTSLNELLCQNPFLQFPPKEVKEPKYYNKDFRLYQKGFEWYKSHYYGNTIKDEDKRIIEINTRLGENGIAKKIYEDFGSKLKLIFIMRNPVERCYSAYKYLIPRAHICQGGKVCDVKNVIKKGYSQAFEEYVVQWLMDKDNRQKVYRNCEPLNYFSGGLYYRMISEYLKYFDISQMRFYLFEDFITNQKEIAEDIFDFIGVPHFSEMKYNIKTNDIQIIPKDIKQSIKYQWLTRGYNYLRQRFGFDHVLFSLFEAIDEVRNKTGLLANEVENEKSKMTNKTRRILVSFYKKDVERLQHLLGKNLLEIWNFS